MQITQWARPGPCSNRLHHGSTAMARHPGRAMACQTYPPSSSNLKSSSLLLERHFPKLAVHNGRGSSIQQTECACPCCVLNTHRRAAKRPLAASLPATPALGHRRCLIVFTVFRGAANDPEMFSVLTGKKKDTTPPSKQLRCMFSRFCTPSHTLPRKGLQQPNLRWSHSLSTHTPAVPARYLVHQSSHTSDSPRSTLPPKWIPTRHREEQASRKPPGQKGSYKTQCKMSAGQRAL